MVSTTSYEWEYINKNIDPMIKPPRVTKSDIIVWTMQESTTFLEKVKDRKFFIVYLLALYTGMRKGEILALRWKDCDLEAGTLSIRQTPL
jgi:integrase